MKLNNKNSKNNLKARRGVSGLISIIAIMLIFGLATLSLLQLESRQAALFSSLSENLKIQTDHALEKINAALIEGCFISEGTVSKYNFTVQVDNDWEKGSTLDSILFFNDSDAITASGYLYNPTEEPVRMYFVSSGKTIEKWVAVDNSSSTYSHGFSIKDTTDGKITTKLGRTYNVDFGSVDFNSLGVCT